MINWISNFFKKKNYSIESTCTKAELQDIKAEFNYAKIWSRYPVYINGSRLTVWINISGYIGDIYIGYQLIDNRIYTVDNNGSIREGIYCYKSNYDGRLMINQKVIDCNNLDVPDGTYEIQLLIVQNGKSPLQDNNIIIKKVLDVKVTSNKDEVIKSLYECYDTYRSELSERLIDPDIKLDDTNSKKALKNKFANDVAKAYGNIKIYFSDSYYRYVTKGFMEYILALCEVKNRKYISEDHDCDDFSFALQGYLNNSQLSSGAFFIVWGARQDGSGAHAVNAFAMLTDEDDESSVKIIEPQNGTIKDPSFMDADGNKWKPFLISG